MPIDRLRLSGMASGIDTESVVKGMMMPYKNRIDKKLKEQTTLEWKKDAWKQINTKILSFHYDFASKLRLQATFDKKATTISDPTMATVGEGSTLPEGIHTIKINKLAQGINLETSSIKDQATAGKDTTMNDLGITTSTTIKINGGDTITIEPTDTIGNIEEQLKNKMTNANVNFDANVGAFFVSTKKTGENQTLSLEVTVGDTTALNKLGLEKTTSTGMISIAGGQNAEVLYNGVTISSATNQVSFNGLNLSLLAANPAKDITITSTQDKEATVSFAKSFVESYNKLIDEVNNLVNASSNSYKPLTTEEKQSLTDNEIEDWEKKVKDSLLRRDSVLINFKDKARAVLGEIVSGNEFKTLGSIGISTGNWKERGKLHLDETKLRDALGKNAEDVMMLFTASPSEDRAKGVYEAENGVGSWTGVAQADKDTLIAKTKGIGGRLFSTIDDMLKSTNEKSRNFLFADKTIDLNTNSIKKQISILQEQYSKIEERYYKRFTAMEKMMNKMNQQMSWLGNQ